MDLTVQAMSGVMDITGFPDRAPVKAGPALCDFFAGVHLYGAIVTALFERERTGRGPHRRGLDARCGLRLARLATRHVASAAAGQEPARTGNRHGGLAESPYNVYPDQRRLHRDHLRRRAALEEAARRDGARRTCADDPRFASLKTRVAHMDVVDELVSGFTEQIHQAGAVRAADEASRAVRAGAHLDGGRERSAPASARHAAMDRSSGARPHRRAVEPDALRRRAATAASSRAAGSAQDNEGVLDRLARPLARRRRAPRKEGVV